MHARQSLLKSSVMGIRTKTIKSSLLAISIALITAPVQASEKGVLKELKEDIAEGKEKLKKSAESPEDNSSQGSDLSTNNYYSEDASSDLNELQARIIYELIRAPFWIPLVITNDQYGAHLYWAEYPYAARYKGFASHEEKEGFRDFHLRVSSEASWRRGNLMHGALNVAFASGSRFELILDHKLYIEGFDLKNEKLNITNMDLNYLFAVGTHGQFRIGLGYMGLFEQNIRDSGIHLTYGFDLFIHRPIVLSVMTSIGQYVESGMGSAKVRATFGALYRNAELFLGYDGHRIGARSLSGPVAGLRLYF